MSNLNGIIQRYFLYGIIIPIVIFVGYIGLQMLVPYSTLLLKHSINGQIFGIAARLDKNEDLTLQKRYPEGYIFANAIFALSVIELYNKGWVHDKANIMVDKSIKKLLSSECRSRFNYELIPKYGAFYNGWTGFVLKKYSQSGLINTSNIKCDVEIELFNIRQQFTTAQQDSIRLIETYPGQVWPADNVVCISVLDTCDGTLALDWLKKLPYSDDNRLMCHYFSSNCEPRGCSQALVFYFLGDMNAGCADNYSIFRTKFIKESVGLDLVREFIQSGEEDYDSGPVIFGVGSAATLMHLKTACIYGKCSPITWGMMNAIGFPIYFNNKKSFLLGQEMMYDLFMLWSAISLYKN